MSDKWGVDAFFWVSGEPSMVRWARATGQITEMVQPKLQDIPDVYDNDPENCEFGVQGAWYVTHGFDGADPGIVYFAPYSTGVFSEIARIPDISGEGYFVYTAFPDGLVLTQPGHRHVYILTQAGVLHHHELPDGFIGDTYDYHQLWFHDVVFNPVDRNIALVFTLESQESYSAVAVGLTRLFTPGQPIAWVDDLYVIEAPEWGEPGRYIPALLRMVFGGGVLFASGESGGDNYAAEYELTFPSNEVIEGPILGILAHGVSIDYLDTRVWPPSGVVATRLQGVARPNRDIPLDPESLPIPKTIPFDLSLRIEPPILDLTAAKMTVDGVPYELDYIRHQPGSRPYTNASASLRAPTPVFVAGESYNIGIELTRGGAGTTVRNLTLYAGGGEDYGRTGYNPTGSVDIGSVSTDIVAQISGTTHRAAHIECQMFQGNQWGGALFLNTIPSIPPFWTAFAGTVEVVGDGASPPGPSPDPDPEPDPEPDPDPEPGEQYADFQLTAGTWEYPLSVGITNVGYNPYIAGGDVGSAEPDQLVFAGVTATMFGCMYNGAPPGYNGILQVFLDDIWGATAMSVEIDGVEYELEVEGDSDGLSGWLSLPESPFVAGQTYDVRLYLEGNLRDTP